MSATAVIRSPCCSSRPVLDPAWRRSRPGRLSCGPERCQCGVTQQRLADSDVGAQVARMGEGLCLSGSSWDQKNFLPEARSRFRCMFTALSAASGETRSPHAPAAACPSARSASTSS
jgi:hypothetical protein